MSGDQKCPICNCIHPPPYSTSTQSHGALIGQLWTCVIALGKRLDEAAAAPRDERKGP